MKAFVSSNSRRFFLLSLITYILFGLIAFGNLPDTFFQQDEWAIFGNLLYWQKAGLTWVNRLFFYSGVAHLTPFAIIFFYFQFKTFGLTFAPYAWISILIHVINALLLVKLVRQLKGSKILAFLSGIFFLLNPTTHQAVTWIATTPGTVLSVTFTLVSLIFFLRRNLTLSLLSFIVALGFKETSVFLFLYLPILWFVIFRQNKRSFRYSLVVIFVLGVLYAGLRLLFGILGPKIPTSSQSIFSQPSLFVYLYRLMTHPFKALSQTVFPQELLIKISNIIMRLGYPTLVSGKVPDPYVAQSVGADTVSYFISLILLGALLFVRKNSYFIVLFLIFIAMSVFPLIAIPGNAGYISLFDGRHLYMTSIGVSIVLGFVVIAIIKKFYIMRCAVIFIVSVYLIYSISYIQAAIATQATIAGSRKVILNQISKWYPKLPDKALVLTKSDMAFYGLPQEMTILPFQSGFGNTLLVWYDMHGENLPACFFEQKFLYELLSEDYKECDGRGFGYFREPTNIKDILITHNLTEENVLSFLYSFQEHSFTDLKKHFSRQLPQ